ncbi:MAG: hypothetical protein RMI63_02940 [Caldimicrobium sp.]|nr:hypothetical protein [Caldimicrobium sp.]MCX7613708.1 hypothetical protein [Caldimicrobium sp.]MDW8093964.1 hypothetical protein [Caldimicrobium sp.]MDW8183127.1 hypothetical protein [Caldimicrobium sp.]
MQNQPISKNPVLLQLSTGLYLGLVCYNPIYENLQFVLEKRDFFEVEWPALMISQEKGLFPVLLGLPHITVQRSQVLWYTTHVPVEIMKQYQAYLPFFGPEGIPKLETEPKPEEKVKKRRDSQKIIPLRPKKGSPDA